MMVSSEVLDVSLKVWHEMWNGGKEQERRKASIQIPYVLICSIFYFMLYKYIYMHTLSVYNAIILLSLFSWAKVRNRKCAQFKHFSHLVVKLLLILFFGDYDAGYCVYAFGMSSPALYKMHRAQCALCICTLTATEHYYYSAKTLNTHSKYYCCWNKLVTSSYFEFYLRANSVTLKHNSTATLTAISFAIEKYMQYTFLTKS